MSYYRKNWLYDEYIKLFSDTTGSDPTEEEKFFLKKYFDIYNDEGAKAIYYMAIFRLKRGWLKYIVFILISRAFKKDLAQGETLDALSHMHNIFAKKMINDAIKAYCKIGD